MTLERSRNTAENLARRAAEAGDTRTEALAKAIAELAAGLEQELQSINLALNRLSSR